MVTLVNFADKKFERVRKWNSLSGKLIGGFKNVLEYGPSDLDEDFKRKHKRTLNYEKGFGNYAWKPYIINKAFNEIKNDDFLFYADSGSFFIRSIKPLVKILEDSGKSILCFNFPLIEKQWTKRDTFLLMDCDSPEFTETPQIMSGFILIRKNMISKKFLQEFEEFSSDPRIISDQENILGYDSYPEFIAHRHDQSILSLMAKKADVLILNDPSDYGRFPKRIIHSDRFLFDPSRLKQNNNKIRVILLSCRKEKPLIYFFKYISRILLSKVNLYS